MDVPLWGWLVFLGVVAVCFAVDLMLGHRGDEPVSFREAAAWSAVWAGIGLAFTAVVGWLGGGMAAGEYVAGFLIEKSLSVDNVFVFAMLFAYFGVPAVAQHRVLLYGVLGALVLRGAFIAGGASLLATFHWAIYILGALLVATGVRMALHSGGDVHPERNPVLRLLRRVVPMRDEYDGRRFWSRGAATPLLGVLVVVATTDVLFAVDSVPAVFAVTRDTFIVFAANAFSVLGLRPMYFLLAGALERFGKLKYGLAAVLVFVGAKMLLADVVHLSVWVSLLIITTILGLSVLVSVRFATPSRPERKLAMRFPVPIRLHPSVLIAVGLVTVLLAAVVLPRGVPGRSGASYAVAAVLGALLFFASVLAHELAHAVIARRSGVPVRQVTLWALGGVADLGTEPPTPGAQFRIAGVGPLVSAGIGALLVGAALLTGGLPAAVLAWIGMTNLALAAFNLLPGAPLDGGRLVSAVVWWRTGDRSRATLVAARAGRGVGLLLLVAGAANAVFGSLSGGIWLMIVGWFLTSTATMEATRARVTGALHGVLVRDVMSPAEAAPGWFTVDAFLERVAVPSRQGVFALLGFDGSPSGVVSLPQLTGVPADDRAGVRAIAVGTPVAALATTAPDEPADRLAERLGAAGVVLVVSDGTVVGLITANEVARAVQLASLRRTEVAAR